MKWYRIHSLLHLSEVRCCAVWTVFVGISNFVLAGRVTARRCAIYANYASLQHASAAGSGLLTCWCLSWIRIGVVMNHITNRLSWAHCSAHQLNSHGVKPVWRSQTGTCVQAHSAVAQAQRRCCAGSQRDASTKRVIKVNLTDLTDPEQTSWMTQIKVSE